MADVLEVDAETGEVVERYFTADELAQRVVDAAATAAAQVAADEQAAVTASATAAAIEHAKSLGFTDAMIAVMYPNLITAEPVKPTDLADAPEPEIVNP